MRKLIKDDDGLPLYVEGSNWDGLSDLGDSFYISQDIDVNIGLGGDQWKIILVALDHYTNNHLPYEDECGIYDIEFFDNLIGWSRKGLK
jgi:hypothetical protein